MDTSLPVIRVAWTFDDGPFPNTQRLVGQLHGQGITAATWFVARHRVRANNYFDDLYRLQQTGHEIGIHEIHPSEAAINWFPRSSHCFSSIQEAMATLEEYCGELRSYNIRPRFVRLPGGEFSELLHYLRVLNCPEGECKQVALDIIDEKPVPVQYMAAREDFGYFITSLQRLDLRVWSGSPAGWPMLGGDPYHYNSWEAECAGVSKGRGADNITYHQARERKLAGISEFNAGIFERKVQAALTTGRSQSVVVLAHDNTWKDIIEIQEDIDTMQNYCNGRKVELRFCTLSELFAVIR